MKQQVNPQNEEVKKVIQRLKLEVYTLTLQKLQAEVKKVQNLLEETKKESI